MSLENWLSITPWVGISALIWALLAIGFLWPGLVEYVTTGKVYLHWSRLLAGAFSLLCAFQTSVFALLLKVLSVWRTQRDLLEGHTTAAESANM